MEVETIDLTDPLEQLCKQYGMSPELALEKLELIKKGSHIDDINKISLNDDNEKIQFDETIDLSSDDEADHSVELLNDDKYFNNKPNDSDNVTEVKIIQCYDESQENSEDDDFFEESCTQDEEESHIGKKMYESPTPSEKGSNSDTECCYNIVTTENFTEDCQSSGASEEPKDSNLKEGEFLHRNIPENPKHKGSDKITDCDKFDDDIAEQILDYEDQLIAAADTALANKNQPSVIDNIDIARSKNESILDTVQAETSENRSLEINRKQATQEQPNNEEKTGCKSNSEVSSAAYTNVDLEMDNLSENLSIDDMSDTENNDLIQNIIDHLDSDDTMSTNNFEIDDPDDEKDNEIETSDRNGAVDGVADLDHIPASAGSQSPSDLENYRSTSNLKCANVGSYSETTNRESTEVNVKTLDQECNRNNNKTIGSSGVDINEADAIAKDVQIESNDIVEELEAMLAKEIGGCLENQCLTESNNENSDTHCDLDTTSVDIRVDNKRDTKLHKVNEDGSHQNIEEFTDQVEDFSDAVKKTDQVCMDKISTQASVVLGNDCNNDSQRTEYMIENNFVNPESKDNRVVCLNTPSLLQNLKTSDTALDKLHENVSLFAKESKIMQSNVIVEEEKESETESTKNLHSDIADEIMAEEKSINQSDFHRKGKLSNVEQNNSLNFRNADILNQIGVGKSKAALEQHAVDICRKTNQTQEYLKLKDHSNSSVEQSEASNKPNQSFNAVEVEQSTKIHNQLVAELDQKNGVFATDTKADEQSLSNSRREPKTVTSKGKECLIQHSTKTLNKLTSGSEKILVESECMDKSDKTENVEVYENNRFKSEEAVEPASKELGTSKEITEVYVKSQDKELQMASAVEKCETNENSICAVATTDTKLEEIKDYTKIRFENEDSKLKNNDASDSSANFIDSNENVSACKEIQRIDNVVSRSEHVGNTPHTAGQITSMPEEQNIELLRSDIKENKIFTTKEIFDIALVEELQTIVVIKLDEGRHSKSSSNTSSENKLEKTGKIVDTRDELDTADNISPIFEEKNELVLKYVKDDKVLQTNEICDTRQGRQLQTITVIDRNEDNTCRIFEKVTNATNLGEVVVEPEVRSGTMNIKSKNTDSVNTHDKAMLINPKERSKDEGIGKSYDVEDIEKCESNVSKITACITPSSDGRNAESVSNGVNEEKLLETNEIFHIEQNEGDDNTFSKSLTTKTKLEEIKPKSEMSVTVDNKLNFNDSDEDVSKGKKPREKQDAELIDRSANDLPKTLAHISLSFEAESVELVSKAIDEVKVLQTEETFDRARIEVLQSITGVHLKYENNLPRTAANGASLSKEITVEPIQTNKIFDRAQIENSRSMNCVLEYGNSLPRTGEESKELVPKDTEVFDKAQIDNLQSIADIERIEENNDDNCKKVSTEIEVGKVELKSNVNCSKNIDSVAMDNKANRSPHSGSLSENEETNKAEDDENPTEHENQLSAEVAKKESSSAKTTSIIPNSIETVEPGVSETSIFKQSDSKAIYQLNRKTSFIKEDIYKNVDKTTENLDKDLNNVLVNKALVTASNEKQEDDDKSSVIHTEVDILMIRNDLDHHKNINDDKQSKTSKVDDFDKNSEKESGRGLQNLELDESISNKQTDGKPVSEGSDDEKQSVEEFQPPQDQEEVRKSLWLQLSTLRSRKNTGALMGNRFLSRPITNTSDRVEGNYRTKSCCKPKNGEENVDEINVLCGEVSQVSEDKTETRVNDGVKPPHQTAIPTTETKAGKHSSSVTDSAQKQLTQAIKSILSDEIKATFRASSQQSDSKPKNHNNADSEKPNTQNDLRKNLKLQFSSLKTSEPAGVFEIVKNKPKEATTDLPKKTLKVKYTEEIAGPSWLDRPFRSVSNDDHFSSIQSTTEKAVEPKDDRFQANQSTDFGFVIQSVTSIANDSDSMNCELVSHKTPEPAESSKPKSNEDGGDVPNIISELRKIIHKPKDYHSKKVHLVESNRKSPDLQQRIAKSENMTSSSKQLESVPKNSNPFESNALDEFLTENSELRVSYDVPKSGAEEGLKRNYTEEDLLIPVYVKEETSEDYPEKTTGEPKIKARTLAEKRRLYEKNQKKLARQQEKAKKLSQNSKRCYVLFEDQKIFVKSHLTSKCIAEINSTKKQLQTKTENIDDIEGPRKLAPTTSRKQSLLRELFERDKPNLKYKAGPLSKKPELQEGVGSWVTELKELPKVMLEIEAEFGKPVHKDILHLMPQSDGEVNSDQVEFALTALVTEEKQKTQKYSFVVPYENNQTQILLRRRQELVVIKNEIEAKEVKLTTEEEVANVVSDLLNYVELKEMAPSLIKEDEDCNYTKEQAQDSVNSHMYEDKHLSLKKRFIRKKVSKTNAELKRLNCKVVEVEVDQPNDDEHTVCDKAFCRLGCVCKSLSGDSLIGLHCGKLKCMFGCNCPKENDKIHTFSQIKFPAGTDLFSTDTVSRIEDEAKRHLAKVERDFTQTIIQTGGQTIVVGFGSKPRRATRAPKKYVDYVDDPEEYHKITSKMELLKRQIKPCRVEIDKFNFSDIMPYCLVHNLYNCYCKGRFKFINLESSDESFVFTDKSKCATSSFKTNSKKEKLENKKKNKILNRKHTDIVERLSSQNNDTDPNIENRVLYSATGRPLRHKKRVYKNDFYNELDIVNDAKEKDYEIKTPELNNIPEIFESARTNPIDRKYKKIKAAEEKMFEMDFVRNITQADLLKINLEKDGLSDSEMLKITLIAEERRRLNQLESVAKKRKRKQILQAREEDNIKIKKAKPMDVKPKVKSVFEGEIIVNDEVWLERFARNTKQQMDGYARILPWKAMLKGFLSKALTVNCVLEMPFRLILTLGIKLLPGALNVETDAETILKTRFPSRNPWCIGQTQNVRDIVKWLSDCSLPEKYNETSISFLLVEIKENQFEIRGLCTQSTNAKKQFQSKVSSTVPNTTGSSPNQTKTIPSTSDKPSSIAKRTKPSVDRRISTNSTASSNNDASDVIVNDEECCKVQEAPTEPPAPLPLDSDAQGVKHRDSDGKIRMLFLTKESYPLQELVESTYTNTSNIDVTSELYMWVSLPQIFKVGKWKMISLKEDFAYLYFKDVKYSIKYVDLVKFTDFARDGGCTLVLKNKELSSAYAHTSFGIYVDQNYSDRIFIGPYFRLFVREDVSTLRYLDGALVDTLHFNQMKGNPNYHCGHWLIERSSITPLKNNVQVTIDLTEDDDRDNSKLSSEPEAVQSKPKPTKPLKQRKENTATAVSSVSTVDVTRPPETAVLPISPAASMSSENVHGVLPLEEDHVIYHKGQPINIKSSKPKAPSEYNRSIITNIPGFGYLGAYQAENSSAVEVSWPFEKKVLVFADGNQATDFLKERFSQLLQPVPETFKIYVMLLKDLKLIEYKPVNSEFLSGHCICGDFGIYNFRALTDEFCREVLHMSKEQITILFARRAQSYIKKKVEELAEIVQISEPQMLEIGVQGILESATKEIKHQETLRVIYLSEVEHQENLAVQKMKKLYNLMSKLPAQERVLQCKIFKNILNIRPQRTVSTEVVEILDDDEDEPVIDTNSRVGSIILPNTAPEDKYKETDIIITPKISSVTSLAMEEDHERDEREESNALMKNSTQPPSQNRHSSTSLFPKKRKMLIDDDFGNTKQNVAPIETVNLTQNNTEPNRVGSIILPNILPQPEDETIPIKKPKFTPKYVGASVIKIGNIAPTTSGQSVRTFAPHCNLQCAPAANTPYKSNPVLPSGMKGLKIVRSNDGKYVVVSDKLTNPPPAQTTVTNLLIQNNQIVSSETYVKPS